MKYNPSVVLSYYLDEHNIELVPEHRFSPDRDWRFDFALKSGVEGTGPRVAIEVDGGLFVGGRHSRGAGAVEDILKLNTALILGWRVVRCTPADVCMDDFAEVVKQVIAVSADKS